MEAEKKAVRYVLNAGLILQAIYTALYLGLYQFQTLLHRIPHFPEDLKEYAYRSPVIILAALIGFSVYAVLWFLAGHTLKSDQDNSLLLCILSGLFFVGQHFGSRFATSLIARFIAYKGAEALAAHSVVQSYLSSLSIFNLFSQLLLAAGIALVCYRAKFMHHHQSKEISL